MFFINLYNFIIFHIYFLVKEKVEPQQDMYRPPKVRPKNLTIGGRYFYGKIQL